MTSYKEKLKQKLIEFQRNIANQKLLIAQTKDEFQEKELAHYLSLFELLDAFENINNTIEEKKDSFDKTAKMLGRNIRSIHRKLLRSMNRNFNIKGSQKINCIYCILRAVNWFTL